MLLLGIATAQAEDLPAQRFAKLGTCALESGATIEDCTIGYRTVGRFDSERNNAIVLLTWHTGKSADLAGLLGPKGLLDPKDRYVVMIDAVGDGVSSSPSNSATQHGTAFPHFTIRDLVAIERRVLVEELGLSHVHAIAGFSMGGTQTFQWLAADPTFMDVAVPISGTPRQSSHDLLLWRTLEEAMLADPAYAQGAYAKNPPLPLFQWIFALNARTPAYRVAHTAPDAFEAFFRETASADDPDGADANDSRWQIDAMIAQDIGAPTRLPARVHVIVAAEDHLVNPLAAEAFARAHRVGLTIVPGDCGHFAALQCHLDTTRAALAKALAR